jgi:hypothetical protein
VDKPLLLLGKFREYNEYAQMKLEYFIAPILFIGTLLFPLSAAAAVVPPQVSVSNHYFDDNSNPQTLTFEGNAVGAEEQVLCNVPQDTQQTLEYPIISASYQVLGTGLGGDIADNLLPTSIGGDGNCVVHGDGGAVPYTYDLLPTTVNVSSLASGTYTLKVTVVSQRAYRGGGYSSASTYFTFTINRPSPTTCTLSVSSNLPTSWTLSGPNNYSGSGTAANYTNAPPGTYTLSAADLTGYNKSISPSASQTCTAGTTTSWSITYTPPPGSATHLGCGGNYTCVLLTGGGDDQDGCTSEGDSCGNPPTSSAKQCNPPRWGGVQVDACWDNNGSAECGSNKERDVADWWCINACGALGVNTYTNAWLGGGTKYVPSGRDCPGCSFVLTGVSCRTSGTPSVDINCSPSSVDYNGSAIVSWTSTNVSSCTISPTGWTGTSGSYSTGALTATTTYTATCLVGGGGSVTTCGQMQRNYGVRGQNCTYSSPVNKPNADACKDWCASQNAVACEWYEGNGDCYKYSGSGCYLESGYGGWYAALCSTQPANNSTVSDSCTVSVNPSAYRNVCIIDGACMRVYGSGRNECSDPGNPDSSDCPQPPPSCSSFTATPDRFAYPPAKSVTLSWSCTKAHNGCTITDNNPEAPDIGSVPQSGSVSTPPLTKTTDYVLKCSGRGGTSPEYHLPLGSLRVYQFTGGKLQEVAPGTQP